MPGTVAPASRSTIETFQKIAEPDGGGCCDARGTSRTAANAAAAAIRRTVDAG
jgi:hypothetical protein